MRTYQKKCKFVVLITILLEVGVLCNGSGICGNVCSCRRLDSSTEDLIVQCRNPDVLTDIPVLNDETKMLLVKELYIEDQANLTALTSQSLQYYKHLETLSIINSGLQYIAPDALKRNKDLRFLFPPELKVCPAHRYNMGLLWKPSRSCSHPNHKGKKKVTKVVTAHLSRSLFENEGILLPLGSGVCSSCFLMLSQNQNNQQSEEHENVDSECLNVEADDTAVNSHDENVYSLRPRSKKEELVIDSQTTVSSLEEFMDSQSSTWSYSSTTTSQVNSALKVLSKGQISPLKSQLTTNVEDVTDRTIRHYKRKAKQGIDALMESIAPDQGQKLFKMIVADHSDNSKTNNFSDTNTDMTALIIKLYNVSEKNQEKVQLLSMIAKKFSKVKLQTLIPGLTIFRIDQARSHAHQHGPGSHSMDTKSSSHRHRMDDVKLEHALDFFFSHQFLQVSSYGMRTLKLENETLTIPQIIRTTCNSGLIEIYLNLCEEQGFIPLSTSTLYKILSSCSAAQKTNLRGLDNIAADGNTSFDFLLDLTKKLYDKGILNKDSFDEVEIMLKQYRIYLKTDYKLHLQRHDRCPDHCINFALSDPKDKDYSSTCDHQHDLVCDRCYLLKEFDAILTNCINETDGLTEEEKEEFLKDLDSSKQSIELWKAHILKTVNQDQAKNSVLDNMDEESILIIIDWAMKFLPMKHREKMTDFFGQKGLSWHVAVVIFKDSENVLKHKTFVHCFQSVKQDWFAVASILESLICHVKRIMPTIKRASIRSDNAGCYHCAHLWLSMNGISERTSVKIESFNYSERQAGKSYCDSKIAHMRCKMRTYVASGGNIQTAAEMQNAITCGKGVTGCHVSVARIDTTSQVITNHKWKNVSLISNLHFNQDGSITVWKAYNIGDGKTLSIKELSGFCPRWCEETGMVIDKDFVGSQKLGNIKNPVEKENNPPDESEVPTEDSVDDNSASGCSSNVFPCPETGCIKTYQTNASLEHHVLVGKHKFRLERKSTFDEIKLRWAQVCTDISKEVHDFLEAPCNVNEHDHTEKGWALKKVKKYVHFSPDLRNFLSELHMHGEVTNQKITPFDAALRIRQARKEDGSKRFSVDQYLDVGQITSYFSKLTVSKRREVHTSTVDDEADEIEALLAHIEDQEIRELALEN